MLQTEYYMYSNITDFRIIYIILNIIYSLNSSLKLNRINARKGKCLLEGQY